MSRNSKNRRNLARAKSFSEIRKAGGKGPTRTQKLHTKRNVWYRSGDRATAATRTVFEPVVEVIATSIGSFPLTDTAAVA